MTLGDVFFQVVELSAANIAAVMLDSHLYPQSSSSQKNNLAKPGVVPTKYGNPVQYKERSKCIVVVSQASKDQYKINSLYIFQMVPAKLASQ